MRSHISARPGFWRCGRFLLLGVPLILLICGLPAHGEDDPELPALAEIAGYVAGFPDPSTHEKAELELRRIEQESNPLRRRRVRAAALDALAKLSYEYQEDFEAARTWLVALLEEYRLPPVDETGIGHAELSLGIVLAADNRNFEAIGALSRAIAIKHKYGQGSSEARGLMALCRAHAALGEIKDARRFASNALRIFEGLNDTVGAAEANYELADIHHRLGDDERALAGYQALLKALEQSDRLEELIEVRADVAIAMYGVGQLDEARRVLQETLEHYSKAGNEQAILNVHGHLAFLNVRAAKYVEALKSTKLVLAAEDLHPILHAYAHKAAGDAQLGLDKALPAIAHFRAALELAEDEQSLAIKVEAGDGLARALLAAGRPGDALRQVKRVGRWMERVTLGLTAHDRMSYRALRSRLFETALMAAQSLDSLVEIAWALEFDRGTSLQAALVSRGILSGRVQLDTRDAERDARRKVVSLQERLRSLDAARQDEVTSARKELAAAERGHLQALEFLNTEAAAGPVGSYTAVSSLSDMKSSLRPNEAFVLFGLTPRQAVALVIQAGDTPPRLVEFERSKVEDLSARLRRGRAPSDLSRTSTPSTPEKERGFKQPSERALASFAGSLKRAGQMIVDKLELLPTTTHVYVSPQAGFATFPWSAIFTESTSRSVSVGVIPSVGTYRLISEDRGKPGSGVVALGDPAYPATESVTSTARKSASWRLRRLPATATEAKRATRGAGNTLLLGPDATKPRLFAELTRRLETHARLRVLHFACHGLVHWDDELRSALALTPDPTTPDGLLRVPEIAAYPIDANLVILSACDTGVGPFDKGEGLRGFARAFLSAGAPRVIVSLWPVDDKATAALMGHLYDGLEKGLSAASALAAAQGGLRNSDQWQHPRYWAAWVLWGLAD